MRRAGDVIALHWACKRALSSVIAQGLHVNCMIQVIYSLSRLTSGVRRSYSGNIESGKKNRKTWSWHSFLGLVQVILVEVWTTSVGHNLPSFRQTQEWRVKSFNKFVVLSYQGGAGSKPEALKQNRKLQKSTLWSLLVVANDEILKRN